MAETPVKERYTISRLVDELRSEGDAYLFMANLRWGTSGVECPHCGHNDARYIAPTNGVSRATRTGAQSQRRVWRCRACRRQFSVLTGTVMHGTRSACARGAS